MPHRTFGIDEVANYLHLTHGEVERLVKDQEIPFERRGARLVFRKVAIDAWASPRVMGLEGRQLADYHNQTSQNMRLVAHEALLPDMIRREFINPRLLAKTKASVVREMAALGGRTGRVWDQSAFLEGLQAREELCSTGLPGGMALLHTRSPEAYLFESPFIVLGRTAQPVPFGAPDGQPTDLFFLLACPDDRLHLHTLARVCLMAQKTELLGHLRAAADAQAMLEVILLAEGTVLAQVAHGKS